MSIKFTPNKYSYLEVVGEAKCLVTLAGDSDLLTGDPYPGDAVLLSLRSRSFCKPIDLRYKIMPRYVKVKHVRMCKD